MQCGTTCIASQELCQCLARLSHFWTRDMRCDNYVVEGPLPSGSKRLTEELAWELHKLASEVDWQSVSLASYI